MDDASTAQLVRADITLLVAGAITPCEKLPFTSSYECLQRTHHANHKLSQNAADGVRWTSSLEDISIAKKIVKVSCV